MNRQLFRCPDDAMIAGVCSGLGKYLDLNPAIVRVFFVLLAVADGIGIFVYILLWAIIPREDCGPNPDLSQTASDAAQEITEQARRMGDEIRQAISHPHPHTVAYFGVGLIVVGVVTLLQNLRPDWFFWLNRGLLWALLLILGGIFLLIRSRRL